MIKKGKYSTVLIKLCENDILEEFKSFNDTINTL
jgi:hypothetical protein